MKLPFKNPMAWILLLISILATAGCSNSRKVHSQMILNRMSVRCFCFLGNRINDKLQILINNQE